MSALEPQKEVTHILTEAAIIKAKSTEKLYRIADGLKNGLSLEVSPEGGKRWRFRYRFKGTAKMISLGTYVERRVKMTHLTEQCACKSDPPWTTVFRR